MSERDDRRTERLTKEAYGFLRTFYGKTRALNEYRISVRRYTVGLASHADYCTQSPPSKCVFAGFFSDPTAYVAPRHNCAEPAPYTNYHWLSNWIYGQPKAPAVVHCLRYETDKQGLEKVTSWLAEAEKEAKEAEVELQKRIVVMKIPDKQAKIFALAEVADVIENKSYTHGKVEYSVPSNEELYEFGRLQNVSTANWRECNLWSEYDIVDQFFSPY